MIKKNIVGLMLKMPEAIQRQLSDAITIIGNNNLSNFLCSFFFNNLFVFFCRPRGFPIKVGGSTPGDGGSFQER